MGKTLPGAEVERCEHVAVRCELRQRELNSGGSGLVCEVAKRGKLWSGKRKDGPLCGGSEGRW